MASNQSISHFQKCVKMTVLSLLISSGLFAQFDQDRGRSTFWNQVRFGGGIGLSFGDGFFSGTLAPSAIYEFNSSFAAGIGLNS